MKILVSLFTLLLLASPCCLAQTDSVTVEARKWRRDKNRRVVYSEWQPFRAMTVDRLPGFKAKSPPRLSKYGGDATRNWKATGFFRAHKERGRWWLVDPLGHPLVTMAVGSIRPAPSATSQQAFAQTFSSPQDWLAKTRQVLDRGSFNGAGSWSDVSEIQRYNRIAARPITYATMLNFLTSFRNKLPKNKSGAPALPDPALVFDPAFAAFCAEHAHLAAAYRADGNLLGHFSDNEIPFSATLLPQVLALKDSSQPAYAAARRWLRDQQADSAHLTADQKDAFVGYVAGIYYKNVGLALKKADPNHLYLGTRLHAAAKYNRHLFAAAEPYLDVVSINFYGQWQPTRANTANWAAWTSKPFFITEFYTKAEESGLSNVAGAGWLVRTKADRGTHYQNFGLALLQAPNCVGWHWFRYQDNDPTDAGTDPPDMASNKGIVDTHYHPYAELLAAMKQLNQNAFGLIQFFDKQRK